MNRLKNYLGLIALGLALLGCNTKAEVTPVTSIQATRLPVDAVIVRADSLVQEESVAGSILANKEVIITSEVAKKIHSIHFKEGSYVSKGQLLYKLEDNEIRARLRQVQAEVALARLSESRLSQLLKTESIRQEEYDVAFTKLQSIQASEELLRIELEKTSIRAPFSGIIGINKAEVGTLVNSGQNLVTLQDHNTVKVQFTVAEKYLPYVKVGKQISFSVGGQKDLLSARISAMESGIEARTRTITIHAVSTNHKGTLRPGMSATVYFSTVDANAKGITLPTESLIPGAQGYSVFAVKNGSAKITTVTVGNRNEAEALITAGLNDGDTVMISNILRSGDGTPVEIVSIK